MRCSRCGRQAADRAAQCAVCGEVLSAPVEVPQLPMAEFPTEMPHRILSHRSESIPNVCSTNSLMLVDPSRPAPQAASMPVQAASRSCGTVSGRLILMEGPLVEPAGFDATLFLCQILWLGLLLLLPLLLLHMVIAVLIVAPSLLVLLIIAWCLGLVSPSHLLGVISAMFQMGQWGRLGGNTIPVRYLRIRNLDDDRESIVRLSGQITAANVWVDDLITFHGRWRRGVFHARRGRNNRTSSLIRIRSNRSTVLLIATLIAYCLVGVTLFALRNAAQPGGVP